MSPSTKLFTACSPACMLVKWLILALLIVATIAAGTDLYVTHFKEGSLMQSFGPMASSLGILSFVVSLAVLEKQLSHCMKRPCDVCRK